MGIGAIPKPIFPIFFRFYEYNSLKFGKTCSMASIMINLIKATSIIYPSFQ